MKAHVKKKWIEALRSGAYVRGQGYLATVVDGETKYCCLGVLCEISPVKGVLNRDGELIEYDDECGTLPTSVMDWAGLKSTNPVVDGQGLSVWNDIMDKSLVEIADIIERHLPAEEKVT